MLKVIFPIDTSSLGAMFDAASCYAKAITLLQWCVSAAICQVKKKTIISAMFAKPRTGER